MIKTIFFIVLTFGALVSTQIIPVGPTIQIPQNELLLPVFSTTDSINHVVIKLESEYGPNSNVPVTVQLKEVNNINGETTSTVVTQQVCTLSYGNCVIVFNSPQLDSSKQYTVKLQTTDVLPKVEAKAQLSVQTSTGTVYKSSKAQFYTSSNDPTNTNLVIRNDYRSDDRSYNTQNGVRTHIESNDDKYYTNQNGQVVKIDDENDDKYYTQNGVRIQKQDDDKYYDQNGQLIPRTYNENDDDRYYDQNGQLVARVHNENDDYKYYNQNGQVVRKIDNQNDDYKYYNQNGQVVPRTHNENDDYRTYTDQNGQVVTRNYKESNDDKYITTQNGQVVKIDDENDDEYDDDRYKNSYQRTYTQSSNDRSYNQISSTQSFTQSPSQSSPQLSTQSSTQLPSQPRVEIKNDNDYYKNRKVSNDNYRGNLRNENSSNKNDRD